ncbi:hypothetical protein ACFO0A_01500 [Novosphingobium tardum]|uniref:DUF2306 domain-containing protein n=1 Tax=Novosphingobium tardum TaxID=1538021 RepID=A0ABV8RK84_9SPHN
MATRATRFAAFHRADRNFYLGFVIAGWLGVLGGFAPPLAGRFAGHADYPAPPVLHIHALAFTTWMVLLAVQVLLVRTGRTAVHRRLGMVSVGLIPIMVLSGFFSEVYSQRFYLMHPPNSQAFFIIPIFDVLAFGALAAAAIANRGAPATHKRLLYLATAMIVGAAWTRVMGRPLGALSGDGYLGMIVNTFTSTNLFLLAVVVFDVVTRGRPHPVLVALVPAIVAGEFAVSWIYHAPGWLPVAHAIAANLPGPPLTG